MCGGVARVDCVDSDIVHKRSKQVADVCTRLVNVVVRLVISASDGATSSQAAVGVVRLEARGGEAAAQTSLTCDAGTWIDGVGEGNSAGGSLLMLRRGRLERIR